MGFPMAAQLLSLTGGPSIPLQKPIVLIGRHPECDIQIDSRKISRRHCCIAQVNDYLVVRDLGSTNGIRINGVRVLEGRLKAEDELTIGGNRYRVDWNGMASGDQEDVTSGPEALAAGGSPARVPAKNHGLERYNEPVPLAELVDPPTSLANDPPLAEPVEGPAAPLIPKDLRLTPSRQPPARPNGE
jgi:predicted component of type VI protein secretion system